LKELDGFNLQLQFPQITLKGYLESSILLKKAHSLNASSEGVETAVPTEAERLG
jgi:hypothetical protein